VRALEIAAAGGHHLIAYGPPGCGKTLALRRFPAILPDMDGETAVTLTRIHSIAGILPEAGRLLVRPPFREPHQNASMEGIIGGGRLCAPGEISLAHGGTLFLDEAALFRESALQALRTPLETGTVTVSRAGRAGTFPARFQLLMAVNPCPCGNFGKEGSICTCPPESVEKYWKKLTAPLLDRIDLRIAVAEPEPSALASEPTVSTEKLRQSIARARRIQWERNARAGKMRAGSSGAGNPGAGWLNAHMDAEKTAELCVLTDAVRRLFVHCMETARLSGRAGHGILRTARTIADLAGENLIGETHLLEAMSLRRWNGLVPDFLL
ncbi:MAG TPA: ATP-binding protein, partial [Treponemataceae bacterium]|nr:ATP-binding protein [Treponemataceae bacterium]